MLGHQDTRTPQFYYSKDIYYIKIYIVSCKDTRTPGHLYFPIVKIFCYIKIYIVSCKDTRTPGHLCFPIVKIFCYMKNVSR